MLVQDLNGQLYATPDEDGAYGLGDPIGFPPLLPILGSLAPIAAKVLPAVLPAIASAFSEAPDDEAYGYLADDEYDDFAADDDMYGWDGMGQLYDGFGNPVGLPALIRPITSVAGGLIGKLVGGRKRRASRAASVAHARRLAATRAAALAARRRAAMMRAPALRRRYRPIPPGWRRPVAGQMPVSRRSYMRCMTWPGVPGLVPVAAPQAALPGAARPRGRRRRRRRRRRR